ncbi:hypothetical protein HHI36_022452 [Cryptolaemus montrouzieri]|uniref:Uncharacterized protein n=1 Tax=Cryptolaemus montrouzieri TaxID=559131 RepID=A0ABD2MZP7_9CUCU
MLKSLNNTSPFSMENLLSNGKISPENLDEKNEDSERNSEESYKLSETLGYPIKCVSPEANRSEGESERCSPNEKNDVFLRLSSDELIKDNKPVLKFSVSAILGDDTHSTRSEPNEFLEMLQVGVSFLCIFNSNLRAEWTVRPPSSKVVHYLMKQEQEQFNFSS